MSFARLFNPFLQFCQNLWMLGTAPWVPMPDATEKRLAQNTAFVMGGEALAFGLFYGYRLLTEPVMTNLYRLTNGTVLVTLAGAYLLSRAGRHRMAAWLSAIVVSFIIFVVVLTGAVILPEYVLSPLSWNAVQLLVVSWVLRPRSTLLLAAANIVALCLLPIVRPDLIAYNLAPVALQVILLAVFIVANTFFRQRDQQVIEARTLELSQSESRYRTLFDNGFEGVLVHRDFQIVDVNPALEIMTGYTRQELLTMRTLDLLTEESRRMVPPPGQIPHTAQYEMEAIRKDGALFPVEVRSKAIEYQGKAARALSVRDLSTQREAEANRTAVLLEQKRNEFMQVFIRNVSHDLRTPMAIINTRLYLAEKHLHQPEKTQEYLDGIKHQITHLSHILDDMLLLTRLEQDPMTPAIGPVDLNAVAGWVQSRHKTEAVSLGISLSIEATPEAVIVQADAAELLRALQRLLENALQYTSPDGHVIIRTRRADPDGVIEVEDTGSGIPSEALPHLFERFYRVDESRNTETGGAGLGLPIAHHLIKAQGGRIMVESTLGKGSTFSVHLPLATDPSTESRPGSL
jgi:PAS domain S-box-containing protein